MANQDNPTPKFVFVAYDLGPSKLLAKVAAEFPGSIVFFGNGGKTQMPSQENICVAINLSHIAGVVTGVSSQPKSVEHELYAVTVADEVAKKPVAAVADTFGTLTKKLAKHIVSHMSLGLVVSPAEVAGTQELMPNAIIEAVGSPTWESYFKPADRGAARTLIGASDDEMVTLVPGTKKPAFNGFMLMSVAGAMQRLAETQPQHGPLRLVFAPHPGEGEIVSPEVWNVQEYFPGIKVQVLSSIRTDDVIPGVDIVFDLGQSSAGMHAIARRIPLVAVKVPGSTEYLRRETGQAESFVAGHRASIRPQNPLVLGSLLQSLRDGSSIWGEQREAQERFMPPMTPGSAVAVIASALRGMVATHQATR